MDSSIAEENEFFLNVLETYSQLSGYSVSDILFSWEKLGIANQILKLGDVYTTENMDEALAQVEKIISVTTKSEQASRQRIA
jgi:hypothetical protein